MTEDLSQMGNYDAIDPSIRAQLHAIDAADNALALVEGQQAAIRTLQSWLAAFPGHPLAPAQRAHLQRLQDES